MIPNLVVVLIMKFNLQLKILQGNKKSLLPCNILSCKLNVHRSKNICKKGVTLKGDLKG